MEKKTLVKGTNLVYNDHSISVVVKGTIQKATFTPTGKWPIEIPDGVHVQLNSAGGKKTYRTTNKVEKGTNETLKGNFVSIIKPSLKTTVLDSDSYTIYVKNEDQKNALQGTILCKGVTSKGSPAAYTAWENSDYVSGPTAAQIDFNVTYNFVLTKEEIKDGKVLKQTTPSDLMRLGQAVDLSYNKVPIFGDPYDSDAGILTCSTDGADPLQSYNIGVCINGDVAAWFPVIAGALMQFTIKLAFKGAFTDMSKGEVVDEKVITAYADFVMGSTTQEMTLERYLDDNTWKVRAYKGKPK